MTPEEGFRDLIKRVREGDEAAAADLVRMYEPEIRRAVRVRHTDPALRRTLDSMDITQSVLANFFVRVAAGQFELDHPEQLLRLLVTMARNRLFDQVRRQQAVRRTNKRLAPGGQEQLDQVADRQESPSQQVALKELLHKLRESLTEQERQLAEQRAAGREWSDIAAETGETPEALRKRLARAINRVAPQFGLDEEKEA